MHNEIIQCLQFIFIKWNLWKEIANNNVTFCYPLVLLIIFNRLLLIWLPLSKCKWKEPKKLPIVLRKNWYKPFLEIFVKFWFAKVYIILQIKNVQSLILDDIIDNWWVSISGGVRFYKMYFIILFSTNQINSPGIKHCKIET